MIEKVHKIVTNDRRAKVRESETAGITIERVQNILTSNLDNKKLPVRFTPQLLRLDNKQTRVLT